MTEGEAHKVHIQYTFSANAFCEIVIWHAAIEKILKLCRRWEREVSLDQKNLNVMLSSPKE